MLKNQSDTANILRERSKLNKRLAYEGLLVGIVSGAVCIVYRLVLSNAESIYFTIRDFVAHNVSYCIRSYYFNLFKVGTYDRGLWYSTARSRSTGTY